jgi:heme exporter protein CcmD
MMDQTSAHAGYVYVSYGLSALVLIGLLVWVLLRSKRLTQQLAARNLSDPGRD